MSTPTPDLEQPGPESEDIPLETITLSRAQWADDQEELARLRARPLTPDHWPRRGYGADWADSIE